MINFFAAAALASAAFVAIPAFADTLPSVEVRYADLHLTNASDAAILAARVNRAAKHVCSVGGDRSLKALSLAQACQKEAVARAMPQVELALANASTRVAENSRVSVSSR